MGEMNFLNLVGYLAAASTTLSFIPQIIKIRKHGGASLSYPMLFIYLFGLILWLIYGTMLHASAVIVANAASILLVALAIIMKAITSRERSGNFIEQTTSQQVTALSGTE
jgi:MtN3 and saliva related transmembrane protein